MKNTLLFLSLSLCLGTFPTSASADTLQLQSVGGAIVNGVYIFPYNFSVNGSSATSSLLCLDYNREITIGEQWNVSTNHIALDSSQASIDYRALALIDYNISTGGQGSAIADLQFADWAIFDPSDMATNSGFTTAAASIEANALNYASQSSLTNSGFYSNFTLYTPTADTTGWTAGIPQEFLGFKAPTGSAIPQVVPPSLVPTPEPSTLAFLGTGLLSVGGLLRRRNTQQS